MISEFISGLLASVLLLQAPASTGGAAAADKIVDIPVLEDTYIRNGSHADKNFGASDTLELKGSELANYERKIFLKFKLPDDISNNFSRAVIELCTSSKESPTRALPLMLYEADPSSWSESELTYNNQPSPGALAAVSENTSGRPVLDITDSLKASLKPGAEISFILTGEYNSPLRANFYAKGSQFAPKIRLTLGSSPIVTDLPKLEGFGEGQDPWAWAKKTIGSSAAGSSAVKDPEGMIKASGSAFVRAGKYADMNFAGSKNISCDSLGEPADMPRKSYLKFDLTGIDKNKPSKAYLDLFVTTIHDNAAHDINIAAVEDNSWSENTITWNNAPETGRVIASAPADVPGAWIRFDITDYVKESLAKGNTLSAAVLDPAGFRVDFGSRTHQLPPALTITDAREDHSAEFDSFTEAKLYPATPAYTKYKTRLLSSLKGFAPRAAAPKQSKYGGNTEGARYEATGYYYMKQINGRWWFVDPEGYLFYNMGVSAVMPGDSEAENAGRNKVYGGYEKWAQGVSDELKDMGFNTAGGWSDFDRLSKVKEPMAQSCILYFLKLYMTEKGLDNSTGGSTTFSNGALNVFDPDFETFCDKLAREQLPKFKDNPNLIGYISDNELPAAPSLLDTYLNLDVTDPRNAYSYAAAWEWLRAYTGEASPSADKLDDETRQDFLEFVYDRYFSVISKAIKKYDPNHLYMGCRFTNEGYSSRGAAAAAGRYCDVITLNYYGAWTPEEQFTERWKQWSNDTPFLVTEWYAMAYDSGLACSSGAGFRVPTQAARSNFYQNYTLGLMETKNCVGFDWFKYMDNDPAAMFRDSSNKDGNKGIYSIDFKPYKELSESMKQINQNAYGIIEFFDKR